MNQTKKYKAYTLRNFREIPQVQSILTEEEKQYIEVVGNVLPFKTNSYVVDELINWDNIPDDPIFQLTFPQKGMLVKSHFAEMRDTLAVNGDNKNEVLKTANKIRKQLNPHPAGQNENVPELNGQKLSGVQHKYNETVLFFPGNSQTCHAYCTFCFRWPQFTNLDNIKFAMSESELLAQYIKQHPEVTDVLFTGGDPMVMSAKNFEAHINPLINGNIPHLKTIRIGSKSLGFWPYRYISDKDSDDMIKIFEKIVKQGYHLSFMAHFSHPRELETVAVQKAITRIRNTGAQIRTQSPILKHINDSSSIWRDMWKKQVNLGMVPYYMFMARDTGAQHYFGVELNRAWNIYRKAYKQVSGIARTVRGPSMSAHPGKVLLNGVTTVNGEKMFVLQFIQGRNADWVNKPFFAKFDPNAVWLDDLEPAFDKDEFFFEIHDVLNN